MTAELPDGYIAVEAPGVRGFAWAPAAPWLESALRDGERLAGWAAAHEGSAIAGGRAAVRSFPAPVEGPDRRERWACRRYRRGGALARALGDRYPRVGEIRPFAELLASASARARGVRTPAVVAGAAYLAGAFYRADIVTELVPRATTLADRLFVESSAADGGDLLVQAGRTVRTLEEARVLHRDLNASNIVVASGAESELLWVLDLDRCRILPEGGRPPGDDMRKRLERSLGKLARRHQRPLTRHEWEALSAGYEARS